MPNPRAGESENEFISRCIPVVMAEGKTQDQALGQCYGMFRSAKKSNDNPKDQIYKAIEKVKVLIYKAEQEDALNRFGPQIMTSEYGKGKGKIEALDLPEEGKSLLKNIYSRCMMDGGDEATCNNVAWNSVINAGYKADEKSVLMKKIENRMTRLHKVMKGRDLDGRTKMYGLNISIENDKGSVREGTDQDGHDWKTVMPVPYGYIRMTEGADGEHVDCFIGDNEESHRVFIVKIQNPKTKEYDEDKVFLGFDSEDQVRECFAKAYNRPDIFQSMEEVEVDKFKDMLGRREGMKIKKEAEIKK